MWSTFKTKSGIVIPYEVHGKERVLNGEWFTYEDLQDFIDFLEDTKKHFMFQQLELKF